MFKVYPEELNEHLKKNKLHYCYIIEGDDQYLVYESQNMIFKQAYIDGFKSNSLIIIDNNINLDNLLNKLNNLNLFFRNQILVFEFKISTIDYTLSILKLISSSLYKRSRNILIILKYLQLEKIQRNNSNYRFLIDNSVLVICQIPNRERFLNYLTYKIRGLKIRLDKPSIKLLCYFYEDNLPYIIQLLEQLKLIYNNKFIPYSAVESLTFEILNFKPIHWLRLAFEGKKDIALSILNKLKNNDENLISILDILQQNIMKIFNSKQNIQSFLSINFDKKCFWHDYQSLFINILNKLSYSQLKIIIYQIIKAELALKENSNKFVWIIFELITLVLYQFLI